MLSVPPFPHNMPCGQAPAQDLVAIRAISAALVLESRGAPLCGVAFVADTPRSSTLQLKPPTVGLYCVISTICSRIQRPAASKPRLDQQGPLFAVFRNCRGVPVSPVARVAVALQRGGFAVNWCVVRTLYQVPIYLGTPLKLVGQPSSGILTFSGLSIHPHQKTRCILRDAVSSPPPLTG